MHTLSLFPALFTFEIFSPILLRLVVSLFIVSLGLERQKKVYGYSSFLYYITAVLLFVGLYAQAAAIVGIVILKVDFYMDYWRNMKTVPVSGDKYFLYGMAIMILLSILVTGPGAFAFDLPL